jgi:tRNA pseudouridine55 synthase
MKRVYNQVDGLLLLDKPGGITSNRALQICKRLFNAQKAGHTGSLDPLATGMLPICFGQATKFSQYLLNANKTYVVTAKLGVSTDSGDSDGNVIDTCEPEQYSLSKIQQVIEGFVGNIEQVPPMYSAIKHKGKKLYELARAGIEVERKPRSITIYSIELINYAMDSLSMQVSCSKGTYIRTLVTDIGHTLGCGAHVTALRRTQVANLPLEMCSLQEIEQQVTANALEQLDKMLLPEYTLLEGFDEYIVQRDKVTRLMQGQAISLDSTLADGLVKLFTYTDKNKDFLGLGEIKSNIILPKRLISL